MSRIHENEVPLNDGRVLGRLTLDHPAALNALRLDMIEALNRALTAWEQRPEVVAVLIDSVGDKAFCAGGDIVNLYRGIRGEIESDYPERFFTTEYRFCHDLRCLKTPVIAWGHGIVMGGGCGLFTGAAHRVVTQTTRLAMPEIKIGLFPDCAATWFFNRLPRYLARFVALTGATLNPADALFAGLAEHAIRHEAKPDLLTALAEARDWQDPSATVADILADLAGKAPAADLADSRLRHHAALIQRTVSGSDLAAIAARIQALGDHDESWLAECAQSLAAGCPMTAHLIHRQIETGCYLSLAECVRQELIMALRCCAAGDFVEGVRALLVDKDKHPRWQHATVADVPTADVARHFQAPWPDHRHPLADLGTDRR